VDLHDKAVGQRGKLEQLMRKIPGYAGYQDRETRRDADKLQRDFCADKLLGQKDPIKRTLDELISGGDIDGITPFEKLMNKIDKVGQRIKNADRGYSGLFDAVKVDDDALKQVYEFDLGLAEAVTEVEHKVKELDADDKPALMKKVKELIALMDRVDDFFDKREEILRKGA